MKGLKFKATWLLLWSLVTGCSMASTTSATLDTETHTTFYFIGRWSPDCERVGGINIYDKKNIIIEINLNQIYIRARGEFHGSAVTLFLDSPEDLGRGGMMLGWKEFSKITPVANMELISEGASIVEWFGFFSDKSNSRVWVNEPDFLAVGDQVFSKCSS